MPEAGMSTDIFLAFRCLAIAWPLADIVLAAFSGTDGGQR